jgi:hypothetical protein
MSERLERIENKLDELIEKTEHRITAVEVNCIWLRRSLYGLVSIWGGLCLYFFRSFVQTF